MTPIGDILQPDHVNLGLVAETQLEGVEAVLSTLNGDPRVRDFAGLREAVLVRNASAIEENGCGICIAHGRTEAISSIVMAAGHSPAGIPNGSEEPVRLIFVAGIPRAFNFEYLRIIGAIARICRDKHQLDRLLAAKTPVDFIAVLGAGEIKL